MTTRFAARPRRMATACIAAALALPGSAYAEDRALVIGIDDYTALPQPAALGQAAADARRFADFLIARAGFTENTVALLTDADATSDAITAALIDGIVSNTAPGDRIVIYFAGLGTTAASASGAIVPAFITYDADSVLGPLPADLFAEIFGLVHDREITLVIDAGFAGVPGSGDGSRTRGLDGPAAEIIDTAAFGTGPAVTLWTAAGPGQQAWEGADGGVFTRLLLEGMGGLADSDGNAIVTNAELLGHLQTRSAGWCETAPACAPLGLAPAFSGAPDAAAFIPDALLPTPQDIAPPETTLGYDAILALLADQFAPTNPAGLTLAIDGPTPLTIGSDVRFDISTQQSGGLVLLDIDTEGQLTQLFPSALAPGEGGDIEAGQAVSIPTGESANGLPLRVTLTGPAGRGVLLAIFGAGTAPQDIADLLPAGLADAPLPEGGRHLYEIAQILLQRSADATAPLTWSAAYLPYEIIN